MYDKATKTVVKKIQNPTLDTVIHSLIPFPNFNVEKFPFLLLRDREGLSIIDIKKG